MRRDRVKDQNAPESKFARLARSGFLTTFQLHVFHSLIIRPLTIHEIAALVPKRRMAVSDADHLLDVREAITGLLSLMVVQLDFQRDCGITGELLLTYKNSF